MLMVAVLRLLLLLLLLLLRLLAPPLVVVPQRSLLMLLLSMIPLRLLVRRLPLTKRVTGRMGMKMRGMVRLARKKTKTTAVTSQMVKTI